MKKTNLYLTIILVALITVILVTGILLIAIVGSSNSPKGDPTDSTSVTVSPTDKPRDPSTTTTTPSTTPIVPETTTLPTPPTTTTIPITTPQTPPTTTTPPPTTTKPHTTPNTPTTPPQTTTTPITPDPPTPGPSPDSGTVTGDQIGSLSMYASYVTENVDADSLTIRVTFYVETYALRIGARADNYLLVNGQRISGLATESINLPNGTPQVRTVLYEYVTTVEKPDDNTPVTLDLEYFWHFQASYSGTHADWLSVKLNLVL